MRYKKDKTHLTSFRMSQDLREQAEKSARSLRMNFSDFLRQSIIRNIHVSYNVEQELLRQISDLAKGKSI